MTTEERELLKFRKLTIIDEWASKSFWIFNGKGDHEPYRIKNGDKLSVLWPNKDIWSVKVEVWQEKVSYEDMGHTYTTTTDVMAIPAMVKGLKVQIRDFTGLRFLKP